MSFYCITLKLAEDEDPLNDPPVADRVPFLSVPACIQDLFADDYVDLSTALLTFTDGSQVLWGQLP